MLLSSDLWVSALIRRVEKAGSFATVALRGDKRYGAVLIKVLNQRTGEVKLYREAQKGEDTVWMRVGHKPGVDTLEADLDAYIERQVRIDADIWVVEIEDVKGRTFLTEKVDEG